MKFNIPVTWTMSGTYIGVEANSLTDAIKKIVTGNDPLPSERDYVSGSLVVEHEMDSILSANDLPYELADKSANKVAEELARRQGKLDVPVDPDLSDVSDDDLLKYMNFIGFNYELYLTVI